MKSIACVESHQVLRLSWCEAWHRCRVQHCDTFKMRSFLLFDYIMNSAESIHDLWTFYKTKGDNVVTCWLCAYHNVILIISLSVNYIGYLFFCTCVFHHLWFRWLVHVIQWSSLDTMYFVLTHSTFQLQVLVLPSLAPSRSDLLIGTSHCMNMTGGGMMHDIIAMEVGVVSDCW